MTMTKIQHIMKEKIVTRANVLGDDEIIYRSEWLGYLPFGLYHWIECHGENVSRKFPSDWSHDDIVALEKIGVLSKICAWENPNDEFERSITYRVNLPRE